MIIKKAYDIVERQEVQFKPQFKVIPNSYEKFMSFDIGTLKFIDSFQFMSSSLESLVDNLKDKTNSNFQSLKPQFPDHHEILCQKGFYPYEWFDNVNKFEHVGLPKIDRFYSCLSPKAYFTRKL